MVVVTEHIAAVSVDEKANMLNNFFARCWNSAESPLTEVSYPPNYCDYWYEDAYVYVSPEEVLHLIKGLAVNKASGPDGVSMYMLKAVAESIAPTLAILFSLSLSSGKFPSLWKSAPCCSYP